MRSSGADRWVRDRLIAGTLGLLAARLALSVLRSGPVLVADEIGYLTNARVITGGVSGQLSSAPFYRGGYSLLFAPFVRLGESPTVAYHLVLALNAVLAACLPVLLYLLLTRRAQITPRVAVWPALAGAVYPSVTIFSQGAFSENALMPLTVVWLICAGGVLAGGHSRHGVVWAVALAASAAALWAVHGTMIVALFLTAVLILWQAGRRRLSPAAAVTGVLVLAAGIYAAHLLDAFLVAHNYGGHSAGEANTRLSALLGFHPLLGAVENLAGQAWYLLAATFGLVGVVVARALRDRRASSVAQPGGQPSILPWALALTALLLLVSAGSFPTRSRPDMLIYGRYVEVVSPSLVALGLALLRGDRNSAPDLRIAVVALAGLTALVALVRAIAPGPGTADRWNVASLPFLSFHLGPGVLLGAGVLGAAGALILARTASGGRLSPGVAALGLFLPVVLYGIANPVLEAQHSVYPSGWTSPQPIAQRLEIRTVAYDIDDYDEIGLYVVQWFLPTSHLVPFRGRQGAPPSRYVISGAQYGRQHPGADASLLWRFAGRNQVLWRLRYPGRA